MVSKVTQTIAGEKEATMHWTHKPYTNTTTLLLNYEVSRTEYQALEETQNTMNINILLPEGQLDGTKGTLGGSGLDQHYLCLNYVGTCSTRHMYLHTCVYAHAYMYVYVHPHVPQHQCWHGLVFDIEIVTIMK